MMKEMTQCLNITNFPFTYDNQPDYNELDIANRDCSNKALNSACYHYKHNFRLPPRKDGRSYLRAKH